MSRRSKGYKEGEGGDAEINLTALIDVVFVVLIVFIIIAPMLEFERISLANSGDSELKKQVSLHEKSHIAVLVKADNSTWVNGRQVNSLHLKQALLDAKLANPKAIPQLFHDKAASFGTYQFVKNTLEAAGFEEMDLVLKPN